MLMLGNGNKFNRFKIERDSMLYAFKWAYEEAKGNLGSHTGGPNELDFSRNLSLTEEAIDRFERENKTAAKRLERIKIQKDNFIKQEQEKKNVLKENEE